MSEMGESYDPGPWAGFNYKSARAAHIDVNAGRGYAASASSKPGKTSRIASLDDLVPASMETTCKSPLVIALDGTGSMDAFPEVIFEKFPLLDLGISDYLEDSEISFAVVGDAGHDRYALQAQPFTKGKGLVGALNKLVIEKGGGGNEEESYDLAATYYAHNVKMPNAVKPMFIFIGDEGIYSRVDKDWAKTHAKTTLESSIKSEAMFEKLKEKFSVYCIRKHYQDGLDGEKMTGANLRIHKQWEKYVGADHIAMLTDPRRVVDVIFGLLAYETGKQDFFKTEITHRQTPAQVKQIMASMVTVAKVDNAHSGVSVVKYLPNGGSITKPLA